MSKGRFIMLWFSVLLFLLGGMMCAYPYAKGFMLEQEMRQDTQNFLSDIQLPVVEATVPKVSVLPTETSYPEEETAPAAPREHEQLWYQMQSYNQRIFLEGQSGLSNRNAYEKPSFRLSDYGLTTEVFGILSIPSLGVEMPLYLGATEEHMAAGAAIMSQTSLPIGGINTNSVIAGHRGWKGADYFLHVDHLQPGDVVTITNLWEKITYQVVEIKIIAPQDVEAIYIRPNQELITLLTCHPPATGGRQRYLVFCERVQTETEVS